MLNVFKKKTDKNDNKMYRTAYLVLESGEKTVLKYQEVDREDITRVSYLRNIQMQEVRKIIKTYNSYPFTTKNKVLIDNEIYSINSFYTEDQEINNGSFIKPKKAIYLVLNR